VACIYVRHSTRFEGPILPDLTAAITAGGRSSRFGSDKALAELGGRPLIAWAAQALAGASERLVVAAPGAQIPALRAAVGPEWEFLADLLPGRGPLSGLWTALQRAGSGWLALTAVDLPLLGADYWHWLAAAREPGVLGVSARGPGGPEPLAAIYSAALRPALPELLRRPSAGLRDVQELGRWVSLDIPAQRAGEPPRFLNVNTPADLERAGRWLG
jgi:molybdopterin-guanine dinucleotide biosynthesis protein A